jgi:hypothetical protein
MPHRHHEVFDGPGGHQLLSRRNKNIVILQIPSGQTFEFATAGFGEMDTIPESSLQRRAGSIEDELLRP